MTFDPDRLTAGPRGRRLCLEVALALSPPTERPDGLRSAVLDASFELDPGKGTSVVELTFRSARSVEEEPSPPPTPAEVGGILRRRISSAPTDPLSAELVFASLCEAVDSARYWQRPGGEDVLATTAELREPLAGVARLVAASPAAEWWAEPVDPADQWALRAPDSPEQVQELRSAAETLARWRAATGEDERRAVSERPEDPEAGWSGTWWSTPPRELVHSTRTLGELGPAGLWLVEDAIGIARWDAREAVVSPDAEVFEIDGPEAWAALCSRYPLEVPASRRHDWYRATGRDESWVIPDWPAVALDYDAVHLSVTGYLATAGSAVEVDGGRASVLAGWGPDETFWLTEKVRLSESAERWERDDDGWRNVPGAH